MSDAQNTELLLKKYRVAFAALSAINCDAMSLTDAQLRARLALQTCIDLGDPNDTEKDAPA